MTGLKVETQIEICRAMEQIMAEACETSNDDAAYLPPLQSTADIQLTSIVTDRVGQEAMRLVTKALVRTLLTFS